MSDADLDVGTPNFDQRYSDWSTGKSPTHPVLGNTQQTQPSAGSDWSKLFQSYSAPKVAAQNPYADLGYNSFLRGMGLQQSQISAQVARQKAGLEAQLDAQRPAWADALSRGIRNIGGAAEANGVFQSGQRLQNQNEFQVDQSRAQNNYESGVRGQQADAQAQMQVQLQDLARQQAEQQLAARQRLAQSALSNSANPLLLEFIKSQLQG